ncbi:MAG: hypothetical protein QGG02_15370, partial [Gammaproteobacteria bacterium]|nr:hypothetical protein [Gammaproteobacteria bacterium]
MSTNNISVYEDDDKFLVKIPATQKLRASRIAGRRWDFKLVAWVYPKTLACYDSLKAEFERDAEVFNIRKPKRKPIPSPPKPAFDGSRQDLEVSLDEAWPPDPPKPASQDSNDFFSVLPKMDTLLDTLRIVETSTNSIEKLLSEQQNLQDQPTGDIDIESPSERQHL